VTEMTENNEQQEQTSQEPVQALPGKKLRAAREARGLSREEVAAQLRLQVRLITALEEDDYDTLPGQTFVTGYLRNYARLLELPEDSFVPPELSSSEPPPLVSTSASRKQASSHDWFTRLATLAIISAIVLSVVMWWMQREKAEQAAVVTPPTVAGEGADLTLSLPKRESPSTESDTAAMPTEAPAVAPTVAPEAPEAKAETTGQPAAAQEGAEQSAEAKPAPLTDDMPQSKLELRYEADSWTEVSDNAGRQLVYGLISAGEVLDLKGEAPFKVFLGYAPGVKVYYNGELFDHAPFQRRDVARFRIGRAEHNHPGSR
jgi:cytoskeleton protein RodZ